MSVQHLKAWLLASLLPVIASAAVPTETQPPAIETVDYCALAKAPEQYDGRIVRTNAIAVMKPESSILYHPSCNDLSAHGWMEWEVPYKESMTYSVRRRLDRFVKDGYRAEITVVGRFHGPRKYEVPPGTDPALAETLEKTNRHYGDQECCEFQIMVRTIEDVKGVDDAVEGLRH